MPDWLNLHQVERELRHRYALRSFGYGTGRRIGAKRLDDEIRQLETLRDQLRSNRDDDCDPGPGDG